MEAPTIRTDPLTTVEAAKAEHRELTALLSMTTDFPDNGSGWSQGKLNEIEQRLQCVKDFIVSNVCRESQDGK
jgi:hypothetical protein